MSVDKFGRREGKFYSRSARGTPGEVISLTEKGHYDMNNKLVRNMGDPKAGKDAVTLHYLQQNCLIKGLGQDQTIECENKTLRNIGSPILENDAVSLQYLKSVSITNYSDGNYNLKQKLIKNLKLPLEDTDAATKGYVDSVTQNLKKEIEDKITHLETTIFKFIHGKDNILKTSNVPPP